MAKLTPEQQELRLRLVAHLRRLFEEHHFEARQDMARRLEIDPGHFSALFNGKSDPGLDFAVQLHRAFGENLNHLCDDDPPARFYPPGTRPGMFARARAGPESMPMAAEAPPSYGASPSAARPEKQRGKRAGGRRR